MQDAPERIWATSADYWMQDKHHRVGNPVGYTRTDLCITEAECQRRIDAAVRALVDAMSWIDNRCPSDLALRGLDNPNGFHAEAMYDAGECARAAIRARGQK